MANGTPAVTCNKPTRTTDAKGQITQYSWDSASGLISKVTPPAPSTGAAQPQTRYTYTSVYGQYWNGSSLVAFGTPVTRLSTISECQTQDFNAHPCAGQLDEVKTSFAYALTGVTNANTLPLQVAKGAGDGSLTATSTISWDLIGNPVLVDGPLSGANDLTKTVYDADREVVGMIGPGADGSKNRARRITYIMTVKSRRPRPEPCRRSMIPIGQVSHLWKKPTRVMTPMPGPRRKSWSAAARPIR